MGRDPTSEGPADPHLQGPLLVDTHEIQGLSQEVVAQSLEQPLHQGHGQTVDPWPGWGIQGLPRGAGCLRQMAAQLRTWCQENPLIGQQGLLVAQLLGGKKKSSWSRYSHHWHQQGQKGSRAMDMDRYRIPGSRILSATNQLCQLDTSLLWPSRAPSKGQLK
jgi:hypothetical protein